MARIRSIKPEFWKSEAIARLPHRTRLTFIALWSYVDDNGIGRDVPQLITGELFALEPDPREALANVRGDLARLSEEGRIVRYTVEGKPYLAITGWTEHQRIDKPNRARYPGPDNPAAVLTCTNADPRDTLATPSRGSSDTHAQVQRPEQGNRGTEEQGRSDAAVAATTPAGTLELARPAGAAAVVAAYVDAVTELGTVLDARAKGRIARDAAALLNERPPAPLELLVVAARRLAANGYADLGTEARKVAAERRGASKPSTTDTRVAATLATAARIRQETA